MVEIQDVRDVLTNLSDERVPDETVTQQIELANTTVENEKAGDIEEQTLEDARLVLAAYYTLNAYATAIERGVGRTPPEISRQMAFWEMMRDTFLDYIKRGQSTTLLPLFAQPATLLDQYDGGDLKGEAY